MELGKNMQFSSIINQVRRLMKRCYFSGLKTTLFIYVFFNERVGVNVPNIFICNCKIRIHNLKLVVTIGFILKQINNLV